MAGWTTDGMGTVGPITVNGVVQTGNGGGLMPEIVSKALASMDTQSPGGAQPQTVAVQAAQIAMIACAMLQTIGTSTAHAVTMNRISGACITEVLTVAVGGFYTFTLTNSLITANTNLTFDLRSVTNTVPGLVPFSSVCSAGSAVLVFQNQGAAALNGTMMLSFHI